MACLLTLFSYDTSIKQEKLERVRHVETALQILGITQVLVRYHDDIARIDIKRKNHYHSRLTERTAMVSETFITLGFHYVTLDLQWFQFGSI